jgi:hypothetical protein
MKRGAWHQLGWNHQKMVIEQLQNGAGVGVILSPRDLSYLKAMEYVPQYKTEGASVVLDPQWHIPGFSNTQFAEYPTADLRASITNLVAVTDSEMSMLKNQIVSENSALSTDAVIAPAVLYAAGRNDIVQLNARLHAAACDAAAALGVPCYGTAFLGKSITSSQHLVDSTLSSITSLNCDGWYFGFQFPDERIPSSTDAVYRCLQAALLLVQTGKPVLHGYAGPLGILSFAAGCTAAASGPSQKQWKFCQERWEESPDIGGGGNAPARYFSRNLWGTIVFPDETALLSHNVLAQVLTPSPFAPNPLPATWGKTNATKHLAFTICKGIESVANNSAPASCRQAAQAILDTAVTLHKDILQTYGITLKDETAAYQANWRSALAILEQKHGDDFEFLAMLQ